MAQQSQQFQQAPQAMQWQLVDSANVQFPSQTTTGASQSQGQWMFIGSQAGAPEAQYTLQSQLQQIQQVPGFSGQVPLQMMVQMPSMPGQFCSYPQAQQTQQFQVPAQMSAVQMPMNLCSQAYSGRCVERIRRLHGQNPQDGNLKLSAVVVTLRAGHSYDPCFQEVPQEGTEGTFVATYEVTGSVKKILEAMSEVSQSSSHMDMGELGSLIKDISLVAPSAVVFNWECCSSCSEESFGTAEETSIVLDLMALLIKRGHMVMCSDFSLKALIKQWSTTRFGPNPFVKIGEFGGSMRLDFDSARVAECPSAQLQRAGDLSESGRAFVKTLASTIAFTVESGVPQVTSAYQLEVLTVATEMPGIRLESLPEERMCEIGGRRGAAGHVLLRYPSGGLLLASAGHWIELVRLDGVSEERLLQSAKEQYGANYSATWAAQMAAAPSAAVRAQMCQGFAQQMVQQSAPCMYSTR